MSLKHALLGFLKYGPMTGYELKKFFDTSVVHFWSAKLSQIYPTLKQMHSEGLVAMKVEVQQNRPNRKVYSITNDGRVELLGWLATSAQPVQIRQPLLIKVFFGASVPKEELIRVLRHEADQLKRDIASLQQLRSLIQKVTEAVGLERDSFFWDLTLDEGIKIGQGAIEWVEGAIGKIEQVDDSVLATQRSEARPVEVRTALEILDSFRSLMPVTTHAAGAKDKSA